MLAARIEEPRKGGVIRSEQPRPGQGEVLIEVRRAGICGTDIHIWNGDYALARFPLVAGHEFSGVVADTGPGVTRFVVGDRVTADPNIPCNSCARCQRNEQNQCLNLAAVGVTRAGAFAEYVVVPEGNVFAIGAMSFAEAALIEPLACVVWGLQRVSPPVGHSALVLGAGPMGCLLLQALTGAGAASVTVVDREESRLDLARRLGADRALHAAEASPERFREEGDGGFDLVVDATGVPAVIEKSPDYARPRGTVWLFGVAPADALVRFSPYQIFRNDLRIVGSFALSKTFPQSIAMIRSAAIAVEPLVSHVLPLAQFEEGLRLAQHEPTRMKVQYEVTSDG